MSKVGDLYLILLKQSVSAIRGISEDVKPRFVVYYPLILYWLGLIGIDKKHLTVSIPTCWFSGMTYKTSNFARCLFK